LKKFRERDVSHKSHVIISDKKELAGFHKIYGRYRTWSLKLVHPGSLHIEGSEAIGAACARLASSANQDAEVKERAEKAFSLIAGFQPGSEQRPINYQ
jgi:hypothetical protein